MAAWCFIILMTLHQCAGGTMQVRYEGTCDCALQVISLTVKDDTQMPRRINEACFLCGAPMTFIRTDGADDEDTGTDGHADN